MDIKVKEAIGSSDKTTSTLDLGDALEKLSPAAKERVKADVGDYIREQILLDANATRSPVSGKAFPKLSESYKKHKEAEGLPGRPDLLFEGDMLDALDVKDAGGNAIEIGWWGSQAAKADGHNNISGDSKLPLRQTIPDVGESFKPKIMKEVEKIITDALVSDLEFKKEDFEDVSTKGELYAALRDYFPDMSRAEIVSAVSRSPELAKFLDDMGLFDLL